MASIRLNWRESQGGDLPMVCATCGDDATEWVERRLSSVRPGLMCIVRTRVTVSLPYCRRHRVASWNGFMRVRARSIDQNGITLGQVSPDFVDAVLDHRERRERRLRRGPSFPDPDLEEVLPADDEEEEEDERRPRRRRSSESSRILYGVLMTGAVILGVSCCGFGLLFANLMRNSPPPAVGPQPGGFGGPGQPVIPRGPFQR
jgi:hypothetical protein